MDELHGRECWKDEPEDPRYHSKLVLAATQRLRKARFQRFLKLTEVREVERAGVTQTALKHKRGATSSPSSAMSAI
jgi:hypothetical protein